MYVLQTNIGKIIKINQEIKFVEPDERFLYISIYLHKLFLTMYQ
jgi:hypothetical protein